MFDGLYAAASGMVAQQSALDLIANNLANAQTTGYRAQQLGFSDLAYNPLREAGTSTTVGAGAAARALGPSSQPGAWRQTGDPLDLAIEGEGFFELRGRNGERLLTRDGSFQLDGNRQLVSAGGLLLEPPITIPAGVPMEAIKISPEGVVSAGGRTVGRIALVTVGAPEHLLAAGEGNFVPTAQSGGVRPAAGSRIVQGVLEGSNVEVASELAQMVLTQRSYQMDSAAVQTAGQMMSIADQIYTQA